MAKQKKNVVLVTGGYGCIGAAVVNQLLEQKHKVVIGDMSADPGRLLLWMNVRRARAVPHVALDVTNYACLKVAAQAYGVTHIVHLAALQTPDCQEHLRRGLEVNVLGTFNIFQLAMDLRCQIRGLAIASSVASEGAHPGAPPITFYGGWKQCGEAMALSFAEHRKVGSVSLMPYIVFGPGRDMGMTSALTKAVKAAVAGEAYHIPFGGRVIVQHVNYVAHCFIKAALLEQDAAIIHRIGGPSCTVKEFVLELLRQVPGARVTWDDANPLPFMAVEDDQVMREELGILSAPLTLEETIKRTVSAMRRHQ